MGPAGLMGPNCVSNVRCWIVSVLIEHVQRRSRVRAMSRQSIVGTIARASGGAVAFAQQPHRTSIRSRRRQRISMMEGVLERAVSNGADNMVRTDESRDGRRADADRRAGGARFRLDGYGVFFDVEVPALRLPVTWPLRYMFRDQPRDDAALSNELRAMMAECRAASTGRLAPVVRQLEQQAQGPSAPRGTGRLGAARRSSGGGRSRRRGCRRCTTTRRSTTRARSRRRSWTR